MPSSPDARTRPPSKRWYRLAGALVVVGIVTAIAWWPYATTRVYDAVEGFERTSPFGGTVALLAPGTHTFWVEGACLSCHDNGPQEYRDVATVDIRDPSGAAVEVRPSAARVFNTARREGRSLWLFDAPAAGAYRIAFDLDTSADSWDNTSPGNIAVSRGDGLPVGIVRPMASFALAGLVAGATVAAVAWWRRRQFYARPDQAS